MVKVRLLIVSTLGVVALGAAASTAANAEPTVACPGLAGTIPVICLLNLAGENLALGLPSQDSISILSIKALEPNGKTTPGKLNYGGLEIVCLEAMNQGTLVGPAAAAALISHLFIRFSECEFVSAPNECEVVSRPSGSGESNVITTLLLDAEQVGIEDSNLVFVSENKPENILSEFRVKSKPGQICAQAETPAKIEGTVLGSLLTPETYGESHLLVFENSGGPEFLLNKTEARLTLTEEVFLDKPANWGTTWDPSPEFALFLRTET